MPCRSAPLNLPCCAGTVHADGACLFRLRLVRPGQ